MSQGAIYNIISGSEAQDKFMDAMDIMKNVLIRQMLLKGAPLQEYITQNINTKQFEFKNDDYRFLSSFQNYIPTMSFLDNSVALFLNYSYKPFAAVAQEYNTVRPSIPTWNNELTVDINKYGQFLTDCVVHVRIDGLEATDSRDRVRYINHPGHRIFDRVQFKIDNKVVDEYEAETYNQHYYREVPFDKRKAWERLMGQQDEWSTQLTPDPLNDLFSTKKTYSNGAQTFKQKQGSLDLWIPLLFFFNNYEQALPLYMLNWGKIQFTFKITDPKNIISFADFGGGGGFTVPKISIFEVHCSNLYTDPLVYTLFILKIKIFMIRTHKQEKFTLTSPDDRIRLFDKLKGPTERFTVSFRPKENLEKSEFWYVNSVLTPNYVIEPVLARNASSIVTGTVLSGTSSQAVLSGTLSSVDSFYTGYYFNLTGGQGLSSDIERNRYYVIAYVAVTSTVTLDRPLPLIGMGTTFEAYLPQLQAGRSIFYSESAPVDTIELMVYSSIPYIRKSDTIMHDTYTPFKTKGVVAARSPGNIEIYFQLEKHSRDLKGYYPMKDGETYLNYTSSYISQAKPVIAYVNATSINFFVVKQDGSAYLYYL